MVTLVTKNLNLKSLSLAQDVGATVVFLCVHYFVCIYAHYSEVYGMLGSDLSHYGLKVNCS